MGIGIYPVFLPDVPNASFLGDGKLLAAEFQRLDDIARAADVRPFTSFGDNRPVPEDFDGDPDELEDLLGEWDEWFSPADGLHTLDALIAALASDPDADDLLYEVNELARCLRVAAAAGAQFRLEMA